MFLIVEERAGRKRVNEPVTVGLPLPQAAVVEPFRFYLKGADGRAVLVQARSLTRWFDGSAKWVLFDFQASVDAGGTATYELGWGIKPPSDTLSSGLSIQETSEHIIVDTGVGSFFLNRKLAKPFDQVVTGETELLMNSGSELVLTDEKGQEYAACVRSIVVETSGPWRATIKAAGEFNAPCRSGLARFVSRISFYANSNVVEIRLTLHNPRAARHRNGLWDLGDDGSIYFKDVSLHIPLQSADNPQIQWTVDPLHSPNSLVGDLQIYQDSSGGENWRSTNHINRFGEVKQSFQGFQVKTAGALLQEGLRASPTVTLESMDGGVTATFDKFWQNFPKAIEANKDGLVLRFFPTQFADVFELQGGEQKTQTIYLAFAGPGEAMADLAWTHDRLVPRTTPEWYAETKACPYLSPLSKDPDRQCRELIDYAIASSNSFFARREIIDEYGWRHFGDLYADHEAIGHTGNSPLVAHYNNQYDTVYGAIVQYLRGGEARWFDLMRDLARHVIDIDIYHTEDDRPCYNGGLFWHTDHYLDAGTATHRSFSKMALDKRNPALYGGGPGNEHNYTTGLLYYYLMTGDVLAKDAIILLANWVINMDDGSRRFLGSLDRRPTGLCSASANRDYHGPGRGAGNSLTALLDAHSLTDEKIYLAKAEELIRRCIHPNDDITTRELDNIECHWSYLVLLQALGKYLDSKVALSEIDYMYSYAQASLLHYAEWMLKNEVPYVTVLHKVELPTETWPAQDIRKMVVFHLAAKYADAPARDVFSQRASFFFDACIRDLYAFETRTLTRPIALLMANAHVHTYCSSTPGDTPPRSILAHDFGRPMRFSPQFAELYWIREKLKTLSRTVKACGDGLKAFLPRKQRSLQTRRG